MQPPKKLVTVIDDDFGISPVIEALRDAGFSVTRYQSASKAYSDTKDVTRSAVVVVDLMMDRPVEFDESSTHGGHRTGIELVRHFRESNPNLPILVFTGSQDSAALEWCRSQPNMRLLLKMSGPKLTQVVDTILELCGATSSTSPLRPFIVHGHDEKSLLQLKNFLQNKLKTEEPVVLRERPSLGRNILQKFEEEAGRCDAVFVLLTPDDVGAKANDTNDAKRRGRQNVIFEMGFFLAKLGRISGRVILLHKGELELPSDIAGMIYISIENGIDAAGEEIRNELSDLR